MNWRQGHRIIVTSTDYHPTKLSSTFTFPVQTEEVGVLSVVGGTLVNLDRPLKFLHWGVGLEAAEVGYVFPLCNTTTHPTTIYSLRIMLYIYDYMYI